MCCLYFYAGSIRLSLNCPKKNALVCCTISRINCYNHNRNNLSLHNVRMCQPATKRIKQIPIHFTPYELQFSCSDFWQFEQFLMSTSPFHFDCQKSVLHAPTLMPDVSNWNMNNALWMYFNLFIYLFLGYFISLQTHGLWVWVWWHRFFNTAISNHFTQNLIDDNHFTEYFNRNHLNTMRYFSFTMQ